MRDPDGPVHLATWIEDNAEAFRPPVANKVVFPGSEFITMVVRGPNRRNDFHTDPGDELFQQLRGTIRVDTRDPDGTITEHLVHEGELFVVPGGVPHSPRRPADTWGLVIERERRPGEIDAIAWYCPRCGAELFRRTFSLRDIETEVAAILRAFDAEPENRVCRTCGHHLEPAAEITLDQPPA